MFRGSRLGASHRISIFNKILSIYAEYSKCDNKHLEEVESHVPLATVGDGLIGEVNNGTVINGLVCELDGKLEIVVALVEFVAHEQV